MQGPRTLLLCGPIGAGKSTVGQMLAARGADVIDSDKVGHRVLEPSGAAWSAVAARWPDTVVDGRIDRAALGGVVFADPEQLAELEELTHPAIGEEILSMAEGSEAHVVVVEVPLLKDVVGAGWPRIVVDAPDEVRVSRLLARGMTVAEIERRMAVQPRRGLWLAAADHVVDNSGPLDQLAGEVDGLWSRLHEDPGFLVRPGG